MFCRATKTEFIATDGIIATNQLGEKHLYSPFVKFYYCQNCGKRLVEEPDLSEKLPVDEHGNYLCGECVIVFSICPDCGYWEKIFDKKYINIKIAPYNYRNIYICSKCYVKYKKCELCFTHHKEEEIFKTKDGLFICKNCIEEKYTRCEECGEYVLKDTIQTTADGFKLCNECYENDTTFCSDCGAVYRFTHNMFEEEDSCDYFCPDCYNTHRYGAEVINNYSYKPKPKFHGRTKEFFGFEIEVSGKEYYAKKFLEAFGDTEQKELYIKHDGSVAGFEIVTQPMSRNYFYRTFVPKLEKGMAFLKSKKFKGHNTAGIHIHVSSKAISSHQLKRMILLMYSKQKKVYKTWLAITQRHDRQMKHWASMNPENINCGKKYLMKRIDDCERQDRKKPNLSSGRYMAINCQNEKTVEFRIFNSNIRIERIIKNAQVIFSLLDFTATNKIPTMSNYLRYIEENKQSYKELYNFLIEKHIYIPKEEKEKQNKIMKALGVKTTEELKSMLSVITQEQNLEIDDNDEQERDMEQCA